MITSDPSGIQQIISPFQPSPFHAWDWQARAWTLSEGARQRAVDSRKAEIDRERGRRNFFPVTVEGVRLDADAISQKNLSDKLQEVRERIRMGVVMPPPLMVWKDADNQMHVFNDLQAYHDWLSMFTIGLAQRGTMLYAAAWQHKAAIEALTTVEAILAYDVTQGWSA